DFFSIGTNDLTQYMLAADRMNENVAHLYDPFHPAIIRMLQMTVAAAKQAGIGIGVCGEMAGDPRALPIWIGLGVHKLSMSAKAILPLKQRIITLTEEACKACLEHILQCTTSAEIFEALRNF